MQSPRCRRSCTQSNGTPLSNTWVNSLLADIPRCLVDENSWRFLVRLGGSSLKYIGFTCSIPGCNHTFNNFSGSIESSRSILFLEGDRNSDKIGFRSIWTLTNENQLHFSSSLRISILAAIWRTYSSGSEQRNLREFLTFDIFSTKFKEIEIPAWS